MRKKYKDLTLLDLTKKGKIPKELNIKKIQNGNKIILSKHIAIDTTKNKNLNTIAIGCPGSGKTHFFIIPNIKNVTDNTNYVIIDPAGELYECTHKELEKSGYNIIKYNCAKQENSDVSYDIFKNIKDSIALKKNVKLIVNSNPEDPFFAKTKEKLLFTLLLYIIESNNGYHVKDFDDNNELKSYTISKDISSRLTKELLNLIKLDVDTLLSLLSEYKPKQNSLFRHHIDSIKSMSKHTIESCLLELNIRFQPFLQKDTKPELIIDGLFAKKVVIFIQSAFHDTTYHWVHDILIRQCISEANNTKEKHTRFIIDDFDSEFSSMENIKDFIADMTNSKKDNVSFMITVCNLSHLDLEDKNNFLSFFNIVLLGTYDPLTNGYISELAGKTTIKTSTTSIVNERKSITDEIESKNILSVDDIRKFMPEQALIFITGEIPIIDEKYYFINKNSLS